jgi:hypothetical protein
MISSEIPSWFKQTALIIKIDAKVWTKKYFRADSVVYLFFLLRIKGINDSKLISNPTQAISQEFAETVIIIEAIKEVKNSAKAGWINN